MRFVRSKIIIKEGRERGGGVRTRPVLACVKEGTTNKQIEWKSVKNEYHGMGFVTGMQLWQRYLFALGNSANRTVVIADALGQPRRAA